MQQTKRRGNLTAVERRKFSAKLCRQTPALPILRTNVYFDPPVIYVDQEKRGATRCRRGNSKIRVRDFGKANMRWNIAKFMVGESGTQECSPFQC